MPQGLEQLTGVGVAGLAVFLIWKLASNEIKHNTEATNQLIGVIKELREFLENHYPKKK